jgi:integral membrane sensor domain MASE1
MKNHFHFHLSGNKGIHEMNTLATLTLSSTLTFWGSSHAFDYMVYLQMGKKNLM